MILYHTTTLEWALAILRTGFQDRAGSYGFGCHELTGVFLASEPVSVNEGAKGDTILRVNWILPTMTLWPLRSSRKERASGSS